MIELTRTPTPSPASTASSVATLVRKKFTHCVQNSLSVREETIVSFVKNAEMKEQESNVVNNGGATLDCPI